MLKVHFITNKPVNSANYIIYDVTSLRCVIIDPGTENCEALIEYISKYNLVIDYVILTHEHIDHIIGINKLKELYDFKLICSVECDTLLRNTRHNLTRLTEDFEVCDTFPNADIMFDTDFSIKWEECDINLFIGKGHSKGSIYFTIGDNLFVGDILIPSYPTVTTLPGGDKRELLATFISVEEYIKRNNIKIYPGHFGLVENSIFCEELSKYIIKLNFKLKTI